MTDPGALPKEPLDYFTRPFARFLSIEAVGGGALLLATICAITIANSPWSASYAAFWHTQIGVSVGGMEYTRSVKHWINDGLMSLFFFTVALELKRELVVGELQNVRIAALSLAGALGGMLVPAMLYLAAAGGGAAGHGWGTVTATDTAFLVGCMAVLGRRVPLSLRLFLLSLAIFDDVGAILVVAIGYSGAINWLGIALVIAGMLLVYFFSRIGVRSVAAYLGIGVFIWLALELAGIHPTLTGIILGFMASTRRWVSDSRLQAILQSVRPPSAGKQRPAKLTRANLKRAQIATREALSPVEQLEAALHPWVAYMVMPLFALANADVVWRSGDLDFRIVTATVLGLAFGKPLGVILFSAIAVRGRLAALPADLSWSVLVGGSFLTGIGFTMALFIAELAYEPGLLGSAKVGITIASIISAATGFGALLALSRSRPDVGLR
jgi:NhaA family Na+:H+ antiporter